MKTYHALTLAIGAVLVTQAHANTLQHVTIYQGKALVERAANIAAGDQTTVFDCLSSTLDTASIQVQAGDGVAVGEIDSERLSDADAKACQGVSESNKNSLDAVNARLKAAQNTLAFLENLSRVTSVQLQGDISSQANQISAKTEEAQRAITALTAEKAQLEASLRQSGSISANQFYRVKVRSASPRASQLSLSYVVSNANWQPQYQAKLDTKTGKLDITLQAIVAQQTGENWQNTRVTLSTSEPSRQTSANAPSSMDLRIAAPEPQYEAVMMESMIAPAPMAMRSMKVGGMAYEEAELPSFVVNSTQSGNIVSYRPTQALTLMGDGKRTTLMLEQKSTQAQVFNRINLNSDLNAYWYAKAERIADNWLPATMQLYRDGSFVGTAEFNQEVFAKQGVGFGRNSQLIARHITNDNNAGSAGLFGGKQTQTLNNTVEITNRLPSSIRVEAVSGIPVSKDSQISVKSSYTPAPTGERWQEMEGVVYWETTLAPNASTRLAQTHTISYPKDASIYGLN